MQGPTPLGPNGPTASRFELCGSGTADEEARYSRQAQAKLAVIGIRTAASKRPAMEPTTTKPGATAGGYLWYLWCPWAAAPRAARRRHACPPAGGRRREGGCAARSGPSPAPCARGGSVPPGPWWRQVALSPPHQPSPGPRGALLYLHQEILGGMECESPRPSVGSASDRGPAAGHG